MGCFRYWLSSRFAIVRLEYSLISLISSCSHGFSLFFVSLLSSHSSLGGRDIRDCVVIRGNTPPSGTRTLLLSPFPCRVYDRYVIFRSMISMIAPSAKGNFVNQSSLLANQDEHAWQHEMLPDWA